MSEEITPTGTVEGKSTENKGEQKSTPPSTIPYSRFSDVVAEKNASAEKVTALEARLAEYDREKSDKIEADQVAKGQYDAALGKYKEENVALKERAAAFDTYELEQRAMLTGKLPEASQEFAKDMGLSQLMKFVESQQTNKVKPREDATPGSRYGGYDNIVEWSKKDSKAYMKYVEQKKKGRI